MSGCLAFHPVTKNLLRNADKSLRLGRFLYLDPAITGYAEQVNQFSASGVYSSASIFQAGRMSTAVNNAVSKSFSSVSSGGYVPRLNYSFEQWWDYFEWYNGAWVVPPNLYYYDWYSAATCRYRYTVPTAKLAGETIRGILLEVSGTGHGTGQFLTSSRVVGDQYGDWILTDFAPSRVSPLNSSVVFDFYLSSTNPSNANFSTPDVTIDCNDGNATSTAGGVQFVFNDYGAYFNDVNYKGVKYLYLDSTRIKNLFSSQYIYLTVKPRLLSNASLYGQINFWGGSLNPNPSSALAFFNNRTGSYTQWAQSCFFYPDLYVYAH